MASAAEVLKGRDNDFAVRFDAIATSSRVGARVGEVAGPLKTIVLLLEDADTRLCLVTTHFGGTNPAHVNQLIRETLAKKLGLTPAHVGIFSSHNHSSVNFADNF